MATTKRVKFLGKVIDVPVVLSHYEGSLADGPVYLIEDKEGGTLPAVRWGAYFADMDMEVAFADADCMRAPTPQRAVSKMCRAMLAQFKCHAKLLGYEVIG